MSYASTELRGGREGKIVYFPNPDTQKKGRKKEFSANPLENKKK